MLKRNLFLLFSITVVAIASLVLCVFNYNPYQANNNQFSFFYLSLLVALTGIIGLIIFYLKVTILKKNIIFEAFWPSIRQALFISLAISATLFLKGIGLYDLWVVVPLCITILLIEMFFRTKKRVT